MTTRPFTLKTNPLRRTDLDDFVAGYNPANRHDRVESERFRAFGYDELMKRDKGSLDIFWLRTTASSSKGTTRSVALLSAWSRSWRQDGRKQRLSHPGRRVQDRQSGSHDPLAWRTSPSSIRPDSSHYREAPRTAMS